MPMILPRGRLPSVKHSFVVRGRTRANRTVVLTLAGDPADQAWKAISIRTSLTPL